MLVALCLTLSGCNNVFYPASISAPSEDLSGNWIVVPANSPDAPPLLTAAFIQSPGQQLQAPLHFGADDEVNRCLALRPADTIKLLGTVNSTGMLQLGLSSPTGSPPVLTATLATPLATSSPGTLNLAALGCSSPPRPVSLIRIPSFSGTFTGTLLSSAGIPTPTQIQLQQSSIPDQSGYFPFNARVSLSKGLCSVTVGFTGSIAGTRLDGATAVYAQGSTGISAVADLAVNHLTLNDGRLILSLDPCLTDTFSGQLDRQ